MKGIQCCGDCGFYDWRKHKCTHSATDKGEPQDSFYADCPLQDVEPVKCGHIVWKKRHRNINRSYICHQTFMSAIYDDDKLPCKRIAAIHEDYIENVPYCSECGKELGEFISFCGNCGAKKDGEK